jgi:hypothetical protein
MGSPKLPDEAKQRLPFPLRRFLVLWAVVMLLACVILPALFKLAAYECGDVGRLRRMVGTEVRFKANFSGHEKTYDGVLKDVHYRLNDKWGWFDLWVAVDGTGMIGTGIGPFELGRITALTDPANPPVAEYLGK